MAHTANVDPVPEKLSGSSGQFSEERLEIKHDGSQTPTIFIRKSKKGSFLSQWNWLATFISLLPRVHNG